MDEIDFSTGFDDKLFSEKDVDEIFEYFQLI